MRSFSCFYDIAEASPTSSHQSQSRQHTHFGQRWQRKATQPVRLCVVTAMAPGYVKNWVCRGVLWQADLSAQKPPLRGITWKKLPRWEEGRRAREGNSSAPSGMKKGQGSWVRSSLPTRAKLCPSKALVLLLGKGLGLRGKPTSESNRLMLRKVKVLGELALQARLSPISGTLQESEV